MFPLLFNKLNKNVRISRKIQLGENMMDNILKTQAVLYDMDGILVNSEPLWEEAEKETIAEYDIDYDIFHRQYDITTRGVRIDQVVDLYCRLLPGKNINKHNMIEKITDLAIDKILTQKPILAGVIESLELCKKLGLKIGLASSSPMRAIEAVTNCLDIADRFDVIVSAEHLDYGKPHPAVYLLAAQKIGENQLNCITIEDSLAGMIATKAARMKSIVVPAPEDRNKPQWCLADYQLSSLLELTAEHLK